MSKYICQICDNELLEDERITIKQHGLRTFIQASIKRKDQKHLKFENCDEIVTHNTCLTMYLCEPLEVPGIDHKSKTTADGEESTIEEGFNFARSCLYCGKDASENFIKKQRKTKSVDKRIVSFVKKPSTRAILLELLKVKTDDISRELHSRILDVPDLVEVGARYHTPCSARFYSSRKCPSSHTMGRPVQTLTSEALKFITNHIFENRHECQFSLTRLFREYSNTLESEIDDDLPSFRYVSERLKHRFGEDIELYSVDRKEVMLCFGDVGDKFLTSDWYENKEKDVEAERQRIVETAARIIFKDVRTRFCDTENYATPDCYSDHVNDDITSNLKVFLDRLLKRNKQSNHAKWDHRVTTLAHSITSSVRPGSFLSTFQNGLSLMTCADGTSEELVNSMSFLGLCSSYDEVFNFQDSMFNVSNKSTFKHSFLEFFDKIVDLTEDDKHIAGVEMIPSEDLTMQGEAQDSLRAE